MKRTPDWVHDLYVRRVRHERLTERLAELKQHLKFILEAKKRSN